MPILPPTKRHHYPHFDALSAMQKHMRRCEVDAGMFFASEFDLSGNGNATFLRLMLYADEDIGLADPLVGIYVGERYKEWLSLLKEKKIKPSQSCTCMEAREILMRTAYVVMSARKSRIVCTATNVANAMDVVTSKALPFYEFEIAVKQRNEYNALYWANRIHLHTKLPEDPKKEEWADKETCLGPPAKTFPKLFDILKANVDDEYKRAVDRWFIMKSNGYNRLHLISATLIAVRSPELRRVEDNPDDRSIRAMSIYMYLPSMKKRAIPDYAYDKHTSKGRAKGRGLKHFWEVGCRVENRGYEDTYQPIAQYFYEELGKLSDNPKSKKIRQRVRRGEWNVPAKLREEIDRMLVDIGTVKRTYYPDSLVDEGSKELEFNGESIDVSHESIKDVLFNDVPLQKPCGGKPKTCLGELILPEYKKEYVFVKGPLKRPPTFQLKIDALKREFGLVSVGSMQVSLKEGLFLIMRDLSGGGEKETTKEGYVNTESLGVMRVSEFLKEKKFDRFLLKEYVRVLLFRYAVETSDTNNRNILVRLVPWDVVSVDEMEHKPRPSTKYCNGDVRGLFAQNPGSYVLGMVNEELERNMSEYRELLGRWIKTMSKSKYTKKSRTINRLKELLAGLRTEW